MKKSQLHRFTPVYRRHYIGKLVTKYKAGTTGPPIHQIFLGHPDVQSIQCPSRGHSSPAQSPARVSAGSSLESLFTHWVWPHHLISGRSKHLLWCVCHTEETFYLVNNAKSISLVCWHRWLHFDKKDHMFLKENKVSFSPLFTSLWPDPSPECLTAWGMIHQR